jgi:acyl-homoserine lactone acylase PvdQ
LLLTGVFALALVNPFPAAAQAPVLEYEDKMRAYSIVPPGQEGDVTADEAVASDFGPHYSDQLEMYASLIDDDNVSEGELDDYYHSMAFDPQGPVEDEYEPTEGVTVKRDDLGIPHIYAEDLQKASFALGYVTAEDRMWQMDLFRNAARGTLSEFVGESQLRMDIETRKHGYTEEEVEKMFLQFDDKFGNVGERIQEGLQAYADGVNAHIDELKDGRADEMPIEYPALGNPPPVHPKEWSPLDTLYLAILQLRVFGETAGGELDNAALLARLQNRHGNRKGFEIFEDFLRRNDRHSYTSIPEANGKFPSQPLGRVKRRSIAIPDKAPQLANKASAETDLRTEFLAKLGFKIPASNALLVSARESATDNPLQIGAPQVGYGNPAFFIDVDVHAPGIDFRGPAVPGASALIPLGRGEDYAWTLTTGYSDAVDVRAEKLCERDDDEVTKKSNHYMFKGNCLPMQSREEDFVVKPTVLDPPGTTPRTVTKTFYRTRHGPVFTRGSVDGEPVAFVKERFFWKKELDSIPQFYKWNTSVEDVGDFKAAARKFSMSFNSFYADHENLGYFHVGYYPRRTRGVHPALPVWGTGQWEWGGRIPFRKHPKVINPDQGWLANWNNKPSEEWDNYDGAKWGPIHRVELLADKMKKISEGTHEVSLSDIVDVIRRASTQDARAIYLGRRMARLASHFTNGSPRKKDALVRVRTWIAKGAHRMNEDRDETLDNSDAIAIFDEWYDVLVHRVYDDELGAKSYGHLAAAGAPILDGPSPQGGGYWFDFSSYLSNTLNRKHRRALARNYCDDLATNRKETCDHIVFSSLKSALGILGREQGKNMDNWTVPAEWISMQNFGFGSVPNIPWQNRGTHNHVVEILGQAN